MKGVLGWTFSCYLKGSPGWWFSFDHQIWRKTDSMMNSRGKFHDFLDWNDFATDLRVYFSDGEINLKCCMLLCFGVGEKTANSDKACLWTYFRCTSNIFWSRRISKFGWEANRHDLQSSSHLQSNHENGITFFKQPGMPYHNKKTFICQWHLGSWSILSLVLQLSDDEQGVYNHLRNARYLGSMKPFSEGDWIPRVGKTALPT